MKSEDLLKFGELVVKKIAELLSSRYKVEVSDDSHEVISAASKFDSPDLNELVFALRRIEKGIFGQCVICRHDIPVDLLETNLTARLCPPCQMALLEKNDKSR